MNRSTPLFASSRRRQRAMTLIELMVVVAIVGVLAALGLVSYQRFIRSSRNDESKQTMLGVVQGVNDFYKRTRGYLDCSDSWTDYYPMAPNDRKHLFSNPGHPDHTCWKLYGVDITPTQMSFTIRAGTASEAPPQPPTANPLKYPAVIREPWFVLVATIDRDNDGNLAYLVATSFAPNQIYEENAGE